jgi:hypothetical protein
MPEKNIHKNSYGVEWMHIKLNSWSVTFLEKLTIPQLVKKFPEFHGTRKFIVALTRNHHLTLS